MKKHFKKVLQEDMGICWKYVKTLKDDDDLYICLFKNRYKGAVPDKTACGVNKHTGKKAYSTISIDEIISKLK